MYICCRTPHPPTPIVSYFCFWFSLLQGRAGQGQKKKKEKSKEVEKYICIIRQVHLTLNLNLLRYMSPRYSVKVHAYLTYAQSCLKNKKQKKGLLKHNVKQFFIYPPTFNQHVCSFHSSLSGRRISQTSANHHHQRTQKESKANPPTSSAPISHFTAAFPQRA